MNILGCVGMEAVDVIEDMNLIVAIKILRLYTICRLELLTYQQ